MGYGVHLIVREQDVEQARAIYGRVIWGADTPDPDDFRRVYVHPEPGHDVLRAVVTRLDDDQASWTSGLGEMFEVHFLGDDDGDPEAALHARMAARGYRPRN